MPPVFCVLQLQGRLAHPLMIVVAEPGSYKRRVHKLYEFNRFPFGLYNAPATFSQLMDNVLSGLSWEVCLYYLDNIIAFSRDWEEHLHHLRMVFLRLREANLRLGCEKFALSRTSVTFLGHLVTEEWLQPDPRLLENIREIQPPTSVTQVQYLLGLVGHC